jgi:hypothetical protein
VAQAKTKLKAMLDSVTIKTQTALAGRRLGV